MWREIMKFNSIWFFDATGCCHKDIKQQKKPFFYSLAMHDTRSDKKKIITFADFVTTANDSINISKFLNILAGRLEKMSKKNLLPNIIVTDMSWALINAVSSSFNNCKPKQYLNWCYKILIDKETDINFFNSMKVRLYLCNSHFLKNISKKAKTISEKVCSKLVRKTFLFMVSLLQNANLVELVCDYLKHIYNIFNNQILDESVLFSLEYLNNELNRRLLSTNNVENERSFQKQDRDKNFESFLKEEDIYMGHDYDKNIKSSSPFSKYFDNMIKKWQLDLIEKNKNKNVNQFNNEFYCPSIFNIIKGELALIPLWSGLMLNGQIIGYECKTRLTNDIVENWFGILKNKLLEGIKRGDISTTQLTVKIYNRLTENFFSLYFNQEMKIFDQNDLPAKNDSIPDEKWNRSKKKRNLKGIYHQNVNIFNFNTNYDYNSLTKNKFIYNEIGQMNNEILSHSSSNVNGDKNNTNDDKDEDEVYSISSSNNDFDYAEDDDDVDDVDDDSNFFNLLINISRKKFKHIKNMIGANSNKISLKIMELRKINPKSYYENQTVHEKLKEKLKLESGVYPILTTGNGNCLYNAIAQLYFNDEDKFYIIKICSIFTLLNNRKYFEKLLKNPSLNEKSISFEEYIENVATLFKYGTEIDIASLMIMLNKKIYVYVESRDKMTRIVYNMHPDLKLSINIGILKDHYFLILLEKDKNIDIKNIKEIDIYNFLINK